MFQSILCVSNEIQQEGNRSPPPAVTKPKSLWSSQRCRVVLMGWTRLSFALTPAFKALLSCASPAEALKLWFSVQQRFVKIPVALEEVAAAFYRVQRTSHLLPALQSGAVPIVRITTLIASSLAHQAGAALLPTSGGLVCSVGCLGFTCSPSPTDPVPASHTGNLYLWSPAWLVVLAASQATTARQ